MSLLRCQEAAFFNYSRPGGNVLGGQLCLGSSAPTSPCGPLQAVPLGNWDASSLNAARTRINVGSWQVSELRGNCSLFPDYSPISQTGKGRLQWGHNPGWSGEPSCSLHSGPTQMTKGHSTWMCPSSGSKVTVGLPVYTGVAEETQV